MPADIETAIHFLETQWSSINENKIKGIIAETGFRNYLRQNNIHFIPGGWILAPGKNINVEIPGLHKICLLPMITGFSWYQNEFANSVTPAQIAAYTYFRQVGVKTYFVFPEDINEGEFTLPTKRRGNIRANYPKSYNLQFKSIAPNGNFTIVPFDDVMSDFPPRNGNRGLRCYDRNRINSGQPPWNDPEIICELFWFEYARYYCQVNYLVSNNDLDLFLIGESGSAYPVELKSKSPVQDNSLGEWFGLDLGPFAKMAFFTANNMNTDALYFVEEVDEQRNHIEWLGIRFTDLVKTCSWVGQSGGTGMTGGLSSTVKIPKAAFRTFDELLPEL